ncbi:sugar diacid recognition domain-containing protein [Caloramator sp. CAR-1]|uniref:CdaR family transcriptional regulator n=1 Tax=Caloramator sp. CAR-1 TaxID=3062777 RepID=UPI0026E41C75|nr:sugar diacid recognition domain-containing protein [Caloramator sp. CAR-1]MDO6354770.1 sugar diacid recognition domain-containing protein [Caloramator sp. CAR-1]
MLSNEDYQKIVNKLINILGKNINIMDTSGIIIASGDSSRIGTIHEGAKIAALKKIDVIIDDKNIDFYKGTKKGINIPIFYNNEVIVVVGITGEPNEIIGYGKIIKELVELMIQEYENKKYETLHFRAIVSFIKELINNKNIKEDELEILKGRAELIGFDINREKTLIVADIIGFSEFIYTNNLKEVEVQELKENIVDFLRKKLEINDVVFNFNEDRFLIVSSHKDAYSFCKYVQSEMISKFKLKFIFGIGPTCNSLSDYYVSFLIANKLIDIGRKINKEILSYNNYSIELLLNDLNEMNKNLYLKDYTNILNDKHKKLIKTVKIYFESGMNIDKTSKNLYVHRNTVIYRINKIKDEFDIDITIPSECMKLYIAIMIYELSP